MRAFIFALTFLTFSSHAMNFTNSLVSSSYPPCECNDITTQVVALGFLFGTPLCAYIAKKCIERKKTPEQKRQEEIDRLNRQIQEEDLAARTFNLKNQDSIKQLTLRLRKVQRAAGQMTDDETDSETTYSLLGDDSSISEAISLDNLT